MKSNRRKFLQYTGLTGISLAFADMMKGFGAGINDHPDILVNQLKTVRIGFIGLGNRGPGAVKRMSQIEGVKIKALCDIRPEKVSEVKKTLEGSAHQPAIYTNKEDEWKKLCELPDIDLVYIATPW